MKLTDFKQSNVHKSILYGPPKSGKTAAVGLLAKHYNLIWFDGEGGVTTLLNPDLKLFISRESFSCRISTNKRPSPFTIVC